MKGYVRALEDRARPNCEVQFAGVATIEAVLTGRNTLSLETGGADRTFRP